MSGDRLPPLFTSSIPRKRDAYTAPAFYHISPVFNTTKPPFDNVLVRYAINMATDKREIAESSEQGRKPAGRSYRLSMRTSPWRHGYPSVASKL